MRCEGSHLAHGHCGIVLDRHILRHQRVRLVEKEPTTAEADDHTNALINAIYVGRLLIGLTVVDELRKVLEVVLNAFPPPSLIGVTIIS